MNKQLKKNVLDLKFHFEIQKINALLVMVTVGILAFMGTFIWYKERIYFGIGISVIIILISIFFYMRVKREINKILEEIEKI